ncbi:SpoIIE family protein phosphatase [Streptomyces sudanensis]|uniref:SpoIIE family protein phosphatase n=2 Tax=Streptomyces sudanensis TaxID=436397 RepID=A0ABY4TPW9_9ACTN|nr:MULTISPECIES: SpoIIE family protein phosphatase [Streptomyces]URN18857.1 SpoIIE family protein phosphatase [Streptomyces sudanensis]
MRRTGASVGAFYLLVPEEDLLQLVVVGGVPAELATPWSRVSLASPAPVSDALRENRLVWIGDQTEMARSYPRSAVALPYQLTLAAVPVSGERRWGTLLLMWPGSRPPRATRRERSHIASSGRRLARLLDEAADAGRPVTAPNVPRVLGRDEVRRPTGSQAAAAAADFAERLPEGCCALDLQGRISYISTRGAALLGGDPRTLLGTLPWQALPWLDDPVYEDRYRAAVISRRPASFTACRPPDRWLDFRLYPDASGVSVRITPAGRRQEGQDPPVADPDRQAPAAPTRVGQLYQLLHLAAALTETVGVQDVVDLVAEQIMPAFGAQGLVLSTAESGRLRITGSRGYPRRALEQLDGLPLDTSFTPAGQALSTGVPSFFGDPGEMARIYPEAPRVSGKQAWAFLPMIASGRPVGVCVLTYDRPHAFPAEERAVLTSLAGLIAQALDRARLYDAKHQLAHGLQEALLPHTLPTAPGLRVAARYLPATRGMDIGGDFYDLLRVDAATVAAVIGDVQGHNVAAAALMGQVRTAVHTHATAGAAPEEVLARTNRLLLDLDPGLFTTCLYARIDLERGRVRAVSAGHPPPLLRCPDGRARRLEVPPGPALGIDPDAAYPVTELDLPPGSVLVLYTDGLVETAGADIEEAIDALAGHLAGWDAREPDRLLELLLGQAGPADRRTDDIALLLVQFSPDAPAGPP